MEANVKMSEEKVKCKNLFYCGFKEEGKCTKDFGHFVCNYEVRADDLVMGEKHHINGEV